MRDTTPFFENDGDGVWFNPARAIAQPQLPPLDTTLVTTVLILLCGNLPAVFIHHIIGARGVPIWPLYGLLYGAIGIMLMARAGFAAHLVGASLPVLLISLLPLASAIWSVTPVETAVQSMTLAGTALTGFYLAAGLPVAQALRVLAVAATAAGCLDLVTIVVLPSVGIEQDGPWVGTWRGLHDQKNGLGAFCALQLLLLVAYVRAARRLDPLIALGLLVNLFLLIAAKSTTSWLTAAVCLPIVAAPRMLLWLIGRVLPLAVAGLALWLIIDPDVAVALLQSLPALVGKDSTLSNRLPVWNVLAPYIEAAPLLGYGYGAFWTDAMMPGEVFMSQIHFLPGSAHSSILEVRLGLGLVGLAAMGLMLVHFVRCLWAIDQAWPHSTGDGADLAPIGHAFFAFLIFQSLTESVLLTRNDLVWVLMVWLAARLGHAKAAG